MKKKLICALMTAAMAGSLVSGLTVSADSDSQVTISLYTTLPNKDSQFEQLCEEFMEENPDIKVNYIAYDSSEKQKWMTLYASGEAPTVSIMDPIDIQENIENMAAYDLDEDSWITDQVDESYLDVFKGEDGKLYAVPNCVTAMQIWRPSARRSRQAAWHRSCLPVWTGLWVLTTSVRYFPVFREMRRRSRTLSTA